ncbi:hypothetical protein HY496_00985 [Candidatus Woesearchaeota archaeon]|nr:hypothetical protein [Candidatus Woesearchaeota archaeon]
MTTMKTYISALGLVGLLSGCDENKIIPRDECRNGDLTLRTSVNQRFMATNSCLVSIYRGDQLIGEVDVFSRGLYLSCDSPYSFNRGACAFVEDGEKPLSK